MIPVAQTKKELRNLPTGPVRLVVSKTLRNNQFDREKDFMEYIDD